MQKLNLPKYDFRFKNSENKIHIFDEIRKKFVALQPEEWVRQHIIQFLIFEKKFPKQLINVEKLLKVNGLNKRYDVIIYHPDGTINVVVECKAPSINICQDTFDQIAKYNLTLKADFLMVTNGLSHYFCKLDYINEQYIFLKDLPEYH